MSQISPSATSLISKHHYSTDPSYGSINRPPESSSSLDSLASHRADGIPPATLPGPSTNSIGGTLHRGLSVRQVQMIAIGGTIGTGLFLGTGLSLAEGGPASVLICYSIVGAIVYVALLLLGEMATQYPVPGESLTFTSPELHHLLRRGILNPLALSP